MEVPQRLHVRTDTIRMNSGRVTKTMRISAVLAMLVSAWIAATSRAGDAPTFSREILPIFRKHCWSCHGDRSKGDLDLRQLALILRGGDSGAAVVAGQPNQSVLWKRIRDREMPPGKDKLSDGDQETIRRWIESGAFAGDASAAATTESSPLWSLQPIRRPAVPEVAKADPRVRNPIDAFLLQMLRSRGLKMAPEADRATLIRRLSFDLTGLPPSPNAIANFVADRSERADERLADELLASPAFGERWARHWLDIVRFAESDGFETNQPRPNAWPYRDYVIRALNENRPYDRFVAEQLAGDALGVDAATGFLVAGAYDQVKSPDVGLTLQQRADELHVIAATTGSTFLGLTVGCARCHHHKFDPISHTDYHAFVAIFAGVHHGNRSVETPEEARKREHQVAELRSALGALDREIDDAEPLAEPQGPAGGRSAVNARRNVERFAPTQARMVRFTVEATNNLEPCIDELEVFSAGPNSRNVAIGAKATSSGDFPGAEIHKLAHINDGRYGNSRSWISNEIGRGWVQLQWSEPAVIDRIVWARDRESKFRDRLPTAYRIELALNASEWTTVATSTDRQPFDPKTKPKKPASPLDKKRIELELQLKDAERVPAIYTGTFRTPEPIHRLHRGDPMQKREAIAPGGLASVTPKMTLPAEASDRERRQSLAQWIADPANPLPARVMVNRLWHYHFGRGLVETPGDFGRQAAKPTHPELLDWLASEFIASGWDMKHIHRLIVQSTAYRQSSAENPAGLDADAENRLLWRFSRRRLEAETIRDSVLAVSGALDRKMGGPGFDLFEPNTNYVKVYVPKKSFGPAEWRRMIYQNRPRMQPDDTFGAFDCPDAGQIAPRRPASTTPLQALNLLNSPFMLQQADLLADRLRKEAGNDVGSQADRGFLLCFGREPIDVERNAAGRLIREHGLSAFCRAMFSANEFLFIP